MNSAEITFNLCPVLRLAEDTGYAEITSWCIWTLFSGRVWLALPLFEGSYMLDFLYVCMTCFVRGSFWLLQSSIKSVPKRSPSRGGDVMVYAWHKPTELAHSFSFCSCVYFCLMALSTVFHSIHSPNSSPLYFCLVECPRNINSFFFLKTWLVVS